MKPNLKA
jgi:hypothetical protein